MTSFLDLPYDGADPVNDPRDSAARVAKAARDASAKVGAFVLNASSREEAQARLGLHEVRDAVIQAAAVNGVPKETVERALIRRWDATRNAGIKRAKSDNCLNGNHSDCEAKGCGCSCHEKNPNRDFSGACADGDHGSCRIADECKCPCHGKASRARTADYNGWANRETWNVAMWMGNDQVLYNLYLDCEDYADFVSRVGTEATPDGVRWDDPALDVARLDEMIREDKTSSRRVAGKTVPCEEGRHGDCRNRDNAWWAIDGTFKCDCPCHDGKEGARKRAESVGMLDGKPALVTLEDGLIYGIVLGDDGVADLEPFTGDSAGASLDDPRVREALGLPKEASLRTAGPGDTREGRECDPNEILRQIGAGNVAAISGGRAQSVTDSSGRTTGVYLPSGQGYGVVVYLDWDDTYVVQRVFGGKVKGEEKGIYFDEVGEAAYRAGMHVNVSFGGHSRDSKVAAAGDLVGALRKALQDAFAFYFRAHGAHWNVTGGSFSEYHALFGEIADDVYSSIDPLAENLRKLGAEAPSSLDASMVDALGADDGASTDGTDLAAALLAANAAALASIQAAFAAADAEGEEGIANFLAERIDMHQKWAWQLGASVGGTARTAHVSGRCQDGKHEECLSGLSFVGDFAGCDCSCHDEKKSSRTAAIRFPGVTVALVGEDGNAFAILGRVTKALKRAGASTEEVDEFMAEATSGDYDHLLATVMRWVEVE